MKKPKTYVPLRLPPDLMAEVDRIGELIDRNRPWIVEDALRDWVASEKWKKYITKQNAAL